MNLDTLNTQQREAVLAKGGPLLILAGAGSGKTRTLTTRIAHLIRERNVAPWRVMAITFTNKAAREMNERVEGLLGTDARDLWIGTFHALSLRILRKEGHRIGIPSSILVYDSADQQTLLGDCLSELGMDKERYPPKAVRAIFSAVKSKLIRLSDYAKHLEDDYHQLFLLYEKKLRDFSALDFDNILIRLVELFELHDDVRKIYSDRFTEVLVDEYQDTNPVQYHLLSLLTKEKKNLVVVGDADQSIYGWRGADIRNILEFQSDFPDARVIKLERNYRSTKTILDAANAVIEYNQDRPPKSLWTEESGGEKIRLFEAYDDTREAEYVSQRIHGALLNGHSLSEMAILYRTHSLSRKFEESLRKSGIAYQLIGGLKFYDRREIKDMLAYLRILENPRDEVSLLRAIGIPKRGIGPGTIQKWRDYAQSKGLTLYEAIPEGAEEGAFRGVMAASLSGFYALMEEHRLLLESERMASVLESLFQKSGYKAMLEKTKNIEERTRIENIGELLSDLEEFEKQEIGGLPEYLQNVSLLSEVDSMQEGAKVTLMTLHSAKGLEYDIIFLVGMDENIFPSYFSIEENGMEEERRLCYVGITRARKVLHLTRADNRFRFGRAEMMRPSQFLEEIPQELLQSEEKKVSDPYGMSMKIPSAKLDAPDYAPGEKVFHQVFGPGTVVGYDAKKKTVQIAFPGEGIKILHAQFAPLRKSK